MQLEISDWIELSGVIATLIGLWFIYKQYKVSNAQIKIAND